MTNPPVPFDPELAAALSVLGDELPSAITPEMIPVMRAAGDAALASPTDDELSRDGAFTLDERTVPGPAGAPDISLLICTPAGVEGPSPAIYHTHGGGMIIGDNRTGLPDMLDIAARYGAVVVSVEYRLAPRPGIRARSRMSTPA